jgi:outer membrane protein OmpA-like peptidoglycan-associated protein
MRRRAQQAGLDTKVPVTPGPTTPMPSFAMRLLTLQRQAGNRAVTGALQVPLPLQRTACAYDTGEREKATDRGVLPRDVRLIAGSGSGYNAAPNSVVVADFRPGSAVIRTSTAEELRRSWIGILERGSQSYALLGFADCVGDEANNTSLRAARANAVAAVLPHTARNASVIGAAPATDFLMPANSTPAERALNRAVLIRLPFEELRQVEEVDEYSREAVKFWQSNPTSSVTDLIKFVSEQAGALLDRNLVPRPTVVPGTAKSAATLAFFSPKDWQITVDVQHMTSASSQKGITSATKMSDLTVDAVAEISSTCYHEFRHAEQDFFAARQTAAEARGIEPKDLAKELDIPPKVADEAVSASLTELPDKYKAQAHAWRSMMPGGRHFAYRQWNEELRPTVELLFKGIDWNGLDKLSPDALKIVWERGLQALIGQLRDLSLRADKLQKDTKALPEQGPLDEEVLKALTKTAGYLFMVLATNHRGKSLPDTAGWTAMSAQDRLQAKLDAKSWLLDLQIHMLETQMAADDAYHAYPNERDSYEVEDLVKESVKQQAK